MRMNSSPLDHLTAFAIVFATGFLLAASFVAYIERVRRKAVLDYCHMPNFQGHLHVASSVKRSTAK